MEYAEIARADSERGEIVLRQRHEGDGPPVLELRVNGVFVMDTLETSTERALAEAALAQHPDPRNVLVGGLGLGYTMHAVLGDIRVERVVVVEIEEALIAWMRDGTVPHGPGYLADQRVSLVHLDIADAMAEATRAAYDLILLDVDNGPGHLVHEHNAEVYLPAFLDETRGALSEGGTLVVWSGHEAPGLLSAMHQVFGTAVGVPQDVRLQDRDEQYWLYSARR